MGHSKLFSPIKVGNITLEHRLVMPPMTRHRADDEHVQLKIAVDYYSQRASIPGTLLITEGVLISPRASGFKNIPGIWNAEHIAAWKEVTDAVHAKRCFIYLQLWALGRVAVLENLEHEEGGPYPVVSSSPVPLKPVEEGGRVPKELTVEEIQDFVQDYANAAENAMAAGFDGVEIHGANGYLVDQFIQDVCNKRTDEYGGSIQNRARFVVEVTQKVIDAVCDSRKVGVRLSPWTDFQGMKMKDPVPQFLFIIQELKKLNLAYLHLVESRLSGDAGSAVYLSSTRRNEPFIELWSSEAVLILAGGFTPESAKKTITEIYASHNMLIAIGRYYISTPDLPFRIQKGMEMNSYDRSTFYKAMSPHGYIDYPFSTEYLAERDGQS